SERQLLIVVRGQVFDGQGPQPRPGSLDFAGATVIIQADRSEEAGYHNVEHPPAADVAVVQFVGHHTEAGLDVPDGLPAAALAPEQIHLLPVGHMVLAVYQAQQRGLATAIGTFDEGVLTLTHGPGEIPQDQVPLIPRVDAPQFDQCHSSRQRRSLIYREWKRLCSVYTRLPAHYSVSLLTSIDIDPMDVSAQHKLHHTGYVSDVLQDVPWALIQQQSGAVAG